MHTDLLVKILSNHRQMSHPGRSQTLTLRAITTLLNHQQSPEREEVTPTQVQLSLQELQAQGEVLAGSGNRFCMAPPQVLTKNEKHLTGVRFVGDRAYLRLAHQALEAKPPFTKTLLHPKVHSFCQIKERLLKPGISCHTVDASTAHMSEPTLPKTYMLQGAEWTESPFQITQQIDKYVPSLNRTQGDRWYSISPTELTEASLLRLPTSEYLWRIEQQFYALTPDLALFTMFWLDQAKNLPLQIPWDEEPGRLNLQGVSLPSRYAQKLWWLSKPDPDQSRTRLFPPTQRPFAREVLARLGCQLV